MMKEFQKARLHYHYAVQLVASVAKHIKEEKDDFQFSMEWEDRNRFFLGRSVPQMGNIRVGVDVKNFAVLILDKGGHLLEKQKPENSSFGGALNQLELKLSEITKRSVKLENPIQNYEDFPSKKGLEWKFVLVDVKLRKMLGDLFSQSYNALKEYATVRVWPHHFDMDALIPKGKTKLNESKYIGIGFSPGDKTHPDPYWYAYPVPRTDIETVDRGGWDKKGKFSFIDYNNIQNIQKEIQEFYQISLEQFSKVLRGV